MLSRASSRTPFCHLTNPPYRLVGNFEAYGSSEVRDNFSQRGATHAKTKRGIREMNQHALRTTLRQFLIGVPSKARFYLAWGIAGVLLHRSSTVTAGPSTGGENVNVGATPEAIPNRQGYMPKALINMFILSSSTLSLTDTSRGTNYSVHLVVFGGHQWTDQYDPWSVATPTQPIDSVVRSPHSVVAEPRD